MKRFTSNLCGQLTIKDFYLFAVYWLDLTGVSGNSNYFLKLQELGVTLLHGINKLITKIL